MFFFRYQRQICNRYADTYEHKIHNLDELKAIIEYNYDIDEFGLEIERQAYWLTKVNQNNKPPLKKVMRAIGSYPNIESNWRLLYSLEDLKDYFDETPPGKSCFFLDTHVFVVYCCGLLRDLDIS